MGFQSSDNSGIIISGTEPLYFARVATTTSLPLSSYAANAITASLNGALPSIDGQSLSVGDTILVKNESSKLRNGIYEVTQLGDGSNPWILTRISNYDETNEIYPSQVSIELGTDNGGSYFVETAVDPVIGVDDIEYSTKAISELPPMSIAFVDVHTTTVLPNSPSYTDGSSSTYPALNALYSATTNGAFPTLQGIAPFVGMKVLVKDQADQTKNGDYYLIAVGSGSSKWTLRRISYSVGTLYSRLWYVSQGTSKGTFFNQTTASLVNSTIGSSGNIVFTSGNGASILTSNKIYVDSTYGSNSTGAVDDVNKPYLTPQYVVSNITNTGTFSCNTTNNSVQITGISDAVYATLKIGQYLSGTNIPVESIIVSLVGGGSDNNRVDISKLATGTGAITGTWITPYTIICNGSFTVTSNLYKEGFFYEFGNSSITWGAFSLFDRGANARYTPEIYNGGNFYGNNALSIFKNHGAVSSSHELIINIKSLYSIGISYAISGNNSFDIAGVVSINCPSWIASAGNIGKITNCSKLIWSGYKYGLLGGIELRIGSNGSYVINDITETSSSIRAIDELVASKAGTINGIVYGSANVGFGSSYITINADMPTGSTFISSARSLTFNGDLITSTGTISGNNVNFNGYTHGNFTVSSALSKFADATGSYTLSGGIHYIEGGIGSTGGTQYLENITLSNSAQLFLNANDVNLSTTTPGNVSVASGSILENRGKIACIITSLAGTLINKGDLNILYKTPAITGTLENRGGYISLYRYGQSESSTYTPTIDISTGTFIMNGGSLVCAVADSLSGLIRKTASGGKVILLSQCYLKVANGLAPLQILSNTGTAQDVMDFSWIDNGAAGFRLANTFSDTTYGTAYAPNLLVGGTGFEATTYSW